MKAYVYRSDKRPDTYVYLRVLDGFDALPLELRQRLGALTFVLEVDLASGKKLARADADAVRAALAGRGYFLQLPPGESDPTSA